MKNDIKLWNLSSRRTKTQLKPFLHHSFVMPVTRNIKECGQLRGSDFATLENNRRFSLCARVGLLLGPLPLWWLTEYMLKLSHSDAFLWLLAKLGIIRYWTKGPFFSLRRLYNATDALWSSTTPARHARFSGGFMMLKKNWWKTKKELVEVSHRCSAIIANRRRTRCITTSFHRQQSRLWRNGTERMELPGREQTWSIPSLWKGTTGHCPNQMGPDALFTTSPQGAPTSGLASQAKGLPGCYRSQKYMILNMLLVSIDQA